MRPILLCLALLTGCGERWPPNTALNVAGVDPRATFNVALTVVRGWGYDVVELDPPRGFFRVTARLDNDAQVQWGRVLMRRSFFSFQVAADGNLVITASGYHVNGDVLHFRLDEERRELADGVGKAMRQAAMRGPSAPRAED